MGKGIKDCWDGSARHGYRPLAHYLQTKVVRLPRRNLHVKAPPRQ